MGAQGLLSDARQRRTDADQYDQQMRATVGAWCADQRSGIERAHQKLERERRAPAAAARQDGREARAENEALRATLAKARRPRDPRAPRRRAPPYNAAAPSRAASRTPDRVAPAPLAPVVASQSCHLVANGVIAACSPLDSLGPRRGLGRDYAV